MDVDVHQLKRNWMATESLADQMQRAMWNPNPRGDAGSRVLAIAMMPRNPSE